MRLVRWFARLWEKKKEAASYTERAEEFAYGILKRYEKDIRQTQTVRLSHRKEAIFLRKESPKAAVRQAESQNRGRIEKLERQVHEAGDFEGRILKKMRIHTEREIRRAQMENQEQTERFWRNMRRFGLEGRKQIKEALEEGFSKEARAFGRIWEELRYYAGNAEKPEVVLVYPPVRMFDFKDGQRKGAVVSGLKRMVQENNTGREVMEMMQEQAIHRIVKENLKEQTGYLTEQLYRRLERQLYNEKKRRGF